jgi:toxin YoeB
MASWCAPIPKERKNVEIEFSKRAEQELSHFEKHKPKLAEKVGVLIADILRDPYRGLGKPEALKHEYSGCWSRRISEEERLVYYIENKTLYIVQCRYHYTVP